MDVHCSWTHNIRGLIWQQEKIGGTHIKCEFDGKIGDRKSVGGKEVKQDKKRESPIRIVGNRKIAESSLAVLVLFPSSPMDFFQVSLKTMKW